MVHLDPLRLCRKKRKIPQGGAILDQVISQSASASNQCLLYKMANYKRGGDLIDAFQIGGQKAVEQLIREQFGVFMYNKGRGQIINRAEYLRWKYMDNHEVIIPIEASLSPHDPLSKWVDHKACWQMQYRGLLGESLLHVLIICDTKVHTKLARILLRVFPEQAIDVMEGEEYLGASALHLAIAYSNNELVGDLIDAGADVSQRATGRFFLPRDQQGLRPVKTTDYEGLAYLGEYPLAWAACCANESVYNLLLECGADPNAQDSFGNMILHMVVVCDKLDMFGYALRHPKLPCKNGIVNAAGLTPLTLACRLGRDEVFREMLELSAREFWRYSNITCSGYPLNALDTLMPDGSTNWNSALFIILNGTKEEHLNMLDGGIVERLLDEKWKTFARNQFLKRLLILAIHLFCLSCSVYLRPVRIFDDDDAGSDDAGATDGEAGGAAGNSGEEEDRGGDGGDADPIDLSTWVRYGFEVATVMGVLSYVVLQQGDEIKNQGFFSFLKSLGQAPAKAIFLISNILILACIPLRIMGDTETEEAILLFAVPGSWFLLMFFAGAIGLTGPFVTMIFSMITGDMFTFGIIYMIVLFGFSQAFFFLYKGHPNAEDSPFGSYFGTWMALFQTTLGDYDYADLNLTTYPNLAKTVFVIFMIFVPILLLNMLIAMMGNTYAYVIEQAEKEGMKQWAKIVVNLERAVTQDDAKRYLEEYSIGLGPSDDPRYETRGVMVIKSKSKTRARQRKGAVSNWKSVLRVTLNELKKRDMTGEELRRIMWGRSSITSPAKIAKKKRPGEDDLSDPFAITAAIDVMSFTQDIVMVSTETVVVPMAPVAPPTTGSRPAPSVPPTATSTSATMFAPHAGGASAPRSAPIAPTATGTGGAPPRRHSTASAPAAMGLGAEAKADYRDPLRELVMISESTSVDENYAQNVKTLAIDASTLDHNPKDIVDPVREREFLKTLEALEDTDSEAGEKPVLGKISLIRRAKSAVSRSTSRKRKTDQHPLFMIAWEDKGGPADLMPSMLPYTDDALLHHHHQQTHTSAHTGEAGDGAVAGDAALHADEPDNDAVTVEELHRRMEQFHQRSRASSVRERDVNSSESSGKHGKARKPAHGRGKHNKISPDNSNESIGGGSGGKPDKRMKSAPILGGGGGGGAGGSGAAVRHGGARGETGTSSPPDPLEPWSTKNIMNINRLLDQDTTEE
ncbi:AGAP000413-PA-like protein [Anopheles sinensis]|uniref:AGAP000413-PA-like protein n=1 Tax=Anopheles sinensis TaxID=74873 RepID=A0A084VX61_ANOSI|nr:AGAP000413-PA-like protein [Anopheles sinensis]